MREDVLTIDDCFKKFKITNKDEIYLSIMNNSNCENYGIKNNEVSIISRNCTPRINKLFGDNFITGNVTYKNMIDLTGKYRRFFIQMMM